MAKDVILFGTGDFARVASVYLAKDSPHKVVGFTVHEQFRAAPTLLDKPVIPFERLAADYPPDQVDLFVAVGFSRLNKAREEVYHACKALGYTLITYVNSKATLWGEVTLGDNVFVFENNVIQPFVTIGSDTIVWSGNHIGHDATVGSHCFLTSQAVISGNVKIGDRCFIGINATIRDGVTIGDECVIGAGALILKDAPPQSVYPGVATEVSKVPSSRLKSI